MDSNGASQKSNALAPFLAKTYDMVDDSSTDHIVSWSSTGSSFVVWNSTDFSRDLLPQYFKHNNLSSFVRQLNTYGFRKICPDQWEFATEGFLKGQRDALKNIRRRKPLTSSSASSQAQDDEEHRHLQPESPTCTIVAHQELEGEVKKLQQDKKLLIEQLTELQLEQKNTESSLLDLGKRLHSLEERQQQILLFLARVADPAFWAQFVKQPLESNMLLMFNKKRRLLASEEVMGGTGESGDTSENVAGITTVEKDALGTLWTHSKAMPNADGPCEGMLRQLNLSLPQSHSLGNSPISLGSGVFLREAHTPVECEDNEEGLVGTGEHQQGALGTGDSRPDDENDVNKTTADRNTLWSMWSNPQSGFKADVSGEGSLRQLSLCLPSNQSFASSPISLSSSVTLKEANTPIECRDIPMPNVSDVVASACWPSRETMGFTNWSRKTGDDRTALSLHLRDRLQRHSFSAPKAQEKKSRRNFADGSGSNDGFWEKYLTESPSSTDSEPDSATNDDASLRERQFL